MEKTDAWLYDFSSLLQTGGELYISVQETQMFLDFGMLNITMGWFPIFI